MFEWHFTIRGADGTDFEGGYYHGRILLPAEYPFKPPNIVFLTPSGRFEVNTKVCLSFSAYHPELWQPAWGIRLILEALVIFLPTKGDGAIGALDWTSEERKRLAKKSVDYVCPICGKCSEQMKQIEKRIAKKGGKDKKAGKNNMFQKEIEHLVAMQVANHDGDEEKDDVDESSKNDGDECVEEEKAVDVETDAEETIAKEDDSKLAAHGKVQTDESAEKNEDNLASEVETETEHHGKEQTDEIAEKNEENLESEVETEPKERKDEVTKEAEEESAEDPTAPLEAASTSREIKILEADIVDESNPPKESKIESETAVETGNIIDADGENITDEIVDESLEPERLQSPLLSDPVVHAGIVIFSIIVWLLLRKLNAIVDDMKELEAEIRQLK